MKTKITLFEILNRFKKAHQDKYDYSLVEYSKVTDKVNIICKVHGIFKQTPYCHYSGSGCSKCGNEITISYTKKSTSSFIKEANIIHHNKYDYSLVNYINDHEKIIIICKEHGQFIKSPGKHLAGQGCYYCKSKQKQDVLIEKFIQFHGNKYDYSKVKYINLRNKILIKCKIHGEFYQYPRSHLNGSGCSKCSFKNETATGLFLEQMFSTSLIFRQKKINKYKVDFFFTVENKKYIVEYNGRQHYEPVRFGVTMSEKTAIVKFEKQQIRDCSLRNYCQKNNITLIEIDGRKYQGLKIKEYLNSVF